jgi:hypothetical protein
VVRRDFIERLIRQVAEAVGLSLRLSRSGKPAEALDVVRQTIALVLGPDHALLERMEATSAVNFIGKFELDRVRLYAGLLAEEGTIHEQRGDLDQAHRRRRHALDLYAAGSLAGLRLDQPDREQIALLLTKVAIESVNSRYRDELEHLAEPTNDT